MTMILGIETTCDETAVSIVEDGVRILSEVTSLQIDLHARFGGVVPELAARRHLELMIPTLEKTLEQSSLKKEEIDAIAVAQGPGLIGAILIGLNTAKALSLAWNVPLIGVNHIEAHLYSAMMNEAFQPSSFLPALGLVLSGGHTSLVLVRAVGDYELLGQTRDDAMGEAFDKVSKMLNLPYPGGPYIEKEALKGDPSAFAFKPCQIKEAPLDFSFSGLKTSVSHALKKLDQPLTDSIISDIAASFQRAAIQSVCKRLELALETTPDIKSVILGGGVTCNEALRKALTPIAHPLPIFWPKKEHCLDNAAMIAGLGFHKLQQKPCGDFLDIPALTTIPFSS